MYKKIHVFRVKPKQDLYDAVKHFCDKNNIQSGVVIGIIGSLERANLGFLKKLPSEYIEKSINGPLEIANGQGSVAMLDNEIVIHVHMTVGNEDGAICGHLARGCIIFSTAEVVIGELSQTIKRAKDSYTGLNEIAE